MTVIINNQCKYFILDSVDEIGITDNTANIDGIFTINSKAIAANTAPFNNGTWLRNL